jgi:Cu/Ag efflux protein CusF
MISCTTPDTDAPSAEAPATEAPSTEAPATTDQESPPAETTTYTAEGTVRSVTPSGRHVMIRHEDIPGFMHAMTMPFEVADTLDVGHLKRDHRIRFTFEAGDTDHVLTNITLLEDED